VGFGLETFFERANRMRMTSFRAISVELAAAALLVLFPGIAASVRAGENLKLNAHLDYSSDSNDGPLITGERMDDGVAAGKPNYIIFYGEACYNSKRQARRTVSLYEKYRGRVNFVVVDLDLKHTQEQNEMISAHYRGSIPHVTILDRSGKAVYDKAGEVEESAISNILDGLLK
jgi:hypothetical protein